MPTSRTTRRQSAGVAAVPREHNDTDFTYAIRTRDITTINQMIAADASILNKARMGKTPLQVAIQGKHLDIVRLLIEHGADVHQRISDGRTPLILAVAGGDLDIVRLLMASGADINQVSAHRDTALFTAVEYEHIDIVRLLLNSGANPNTFAGFHNNPPLMLAIGSDNMECIELLVEYGANVNADVNSTTPLHWAVENNNLEAAEFLLEHGADVNKMDVMGRTPFSLALESGLVHISRMFVEHGVDVNNLPNGVVPLVAEAYLGNLENVRLLIEFGADVNRANRHQMTPLRAAIKKRRVQVAQFLIHAGATLTESDRELAGPDLLSQIEGENAIPAPVEQPAMWEGFEKSLLVSYELMLFHDRPDSLSSFSRCPVCIGEGGRDRGCNYMYHVCDRSHYFNDKLYAKYSTDEGMIWWCAVCGRICKGHAHYKLGSHNARRPPLNPGGPMYGTTCSGDHGKGGGNVEEKIARFRAMFQTYAELQDRIGVITRKEAMDLVTNRMWDAPLHITEADREAIATIIANKSFGIDPSVFSNNSTTAPVSAVVSTGAPPGSFEPPEIITEGEDLYNAVSAIPANENPLIRFTHKKADGTMHRHPDDALVSKRSLLDHIINTATSDLAYKCFDCGGYLWPEEVEMAFADPRLEVTPAESTTIANYKKRFYRDVVLPTAGGRRRRLTRKRKAQRKLRRKQTRRK